MARFNNPESVVVSFTASNDPDEEFMLIGKKLPQHAVDVINYVEGPRARDIWTALTEPKKVTDDGTR